MLLVGIVAILASLFAVFFIYHRCISYCGQLTQQRLPNGLKVWTIGGDMLFPLVYREIFVTNDYFRHGISLDGRRAPLVVDVGANVGLFTLYIATTFPTATVVGAEPIPLLCTAARRNTSECGDVKLFAVGIGEVAGSSTFSFDPAASAATTQHMGVINVPTQSHGLKEWLRAALVDYVTASVLPQQPSALVAALLDVPMLGWVMILLLSPLLLVFVIFLLARPRLATKVTCPIWTLPQLLHAAAVDPSRRIDLLKIDVEGAEWDVVMGISDDKWATVDQVVVEVHDLNGRALKMANHLRSKGFNVMEDAEDWEMHKLLKCVTLF